MRFLIALSIVFPAAVLTAHGSENNSAGTGADTDKSGFYILRNEWRTFWKEGWHLGENHISWNDGLRIDNDKRRLRTKVNAVINIDAGDIGDDQELGAAFPGLAGRASALRRLRIDVSGQYTELWDFKGQFNFAEKFTLGDFWLRRRQLPYIHNVTLGQVTEPFSLEQLESSQGSLFMERALPVEAFAPGRNIGVAIHNTQLNERLTWSLGAFLETSSLGDGVNAKDAIDSAQGANLTARITGLAWHQPEAARFLHLGLSYSHQFRDVLYDGGKVRFRSRPESRLDDDRLVDTGEFSTDGVDLIDPELALGHGSALLQGEYFHARTAEGLDFRGFYVQASYLLSGEAYAYDTRKGVVARLRPDRNFKPAQNTWGAWELGVRYSHLDLNDGPIQGGKERNFTLGLNWYLNPNARLMFNYIHAEIKDRANPAVANGKADIVQTRLQLNF